ncbi:hypothetical protein DRO69_02080 [Candidatus Bathyarchaeota archaeon]|nr:MAG: hypothetical protein DRO69_02080 [Candidatus Bathyarchaeota archaeon]
MTRVFLLDTKCGSCSLLVKEGANRFSCPRNPRGIPRLVPQNWATHCSNYVAGKPKKQKPSKQETVFFTRWFGVRVTPDYRSVIVVAKKGFKLVVSQSSEEKIVVTSLKKEEVE